MHVNYAWGGFRLVAAFGNSQINIGGRLYPPIRARSGGRVLLMATGPSYVVLWMSERGAYGKWQPKTDPPTREHAL